MSSLTALKSEFTLTPADDMVDAEWSLKANPNIGVQVSPYLGLGSQYTVNVWLPAEQAMQEHSTHKTLTAALEAAIEANGDTDAKI